MKIHEFQGKEILRQAGVAVPRSIVARTPEEAAAAFKQLGGKLAVVKAQIHAGGRGKGTIKTNPQQRGVQLVKSRRRGREGGRRTARQAAGHDPDRPRRADRAAGAGRRRLRHRPRAVPGHRGRSRGGQAGADGLQRRGHEHRGGRRQDAGADLQGALRSGRRAAELTRSASCARSWASKGPASARPRSS